MAGKTQEAKASMTGFSVVAVTGLSGAGRSTVLRALEDLGYYCVDNLPPAAFSPALEQCARDQLQRVALGIDVRLRSFLDRAIAAVEKVRSDPAFNFKLVYVDASDAALLSRFSGTRRPHPLRTMNVAEAQSMAVVDGIKIERERLAPLRANASIVIDTSELSVHDLRRRVIKLFRPRSRNSTGMLARLVSFGFKYGAPQDLDLMFDVRFVHNPYFVPQLRPLSGKDEAVSDYVLERSSEFLRHTEPLLSYLIPQYEKEGKSYLTVGFGCTGGRHRSVALSEHLAQKLGKPLSRSIEVVHRDVNRVRAEETAQAEAAKALAKGLADG